MIFNIGDPLQVDDDIGNFLLGKMLLRHLAKISGECNLRLLQSTDDGIFANPDIGPRKIGSEVATKSEGCVAVVTVAFFKGTLAPDNLIIKFVGMSQRGKVAGGIYRQHDKQCQGYQVPIQKISLAVELLIFPSLQPGIGCACWFSI